MANENTKQNTAPELTPEQKAKAEKKAVKRAEKKAKRENQRKAFNDLKVAIAKSKDEDVKKAYAVLEALSSAKRTGTPSLTNYQKFVEYIIEKKSVSEDEVFKMFKVGRKDCAGYIRKFLKNCEPAKRVWINFTPSDGLYKVIGTGIKVPVEYTGYVPADDITDLKQPNLK